MTDREDLGRLRAHGDLWQLSFTRFFPHPPEKVWRALLEPEHLAAWFPARIDGERRTGAALRFVFEHGEGPPGDGTVLACEPPEGPDRRGLFEFTWDAETLRFEIAADGDGTLLTLLNTFDELGKAARDAAGWHYCLEMLGFDLAETTPTADAVQRWKTIHPFYVEAFGPEASVLGPPDTMPEYQ